MAAFDGRFDPRQPVSCRIGSKVSPTRGVRGPGDREPRKAFQHVDPPAGGLLPFNKIHTTGWGSDPTNHQDVPCATRGR
jgi:hypothetical protein